MDEVVREAARVSGTDMARVKVVNDKEPRATGEYVLWWPTECPRVQWNDTYELAKSIAVQADLPMICLYAIDLEFYSMGSIRHINFLLEGLAELKKSVESSNQSRLFLRFERAGHGAALSVVGSEDLSFSGFGEKAYVVVTDAVYMQRSSKILAAAAENLDCPLVSVESSVVIPIREITTDGQVPAQNAFLESWMDICTDFGKPVQSVKLTRSVPSSMEKLDCGNVFGPRDREWHPGDWLQESDRLKEVLSSNGVDSEVSSVTSAYRGGESGGRKLLGIFVTRKLDAYGYASENYGETKRGEYGSLLSPYLNFGFISPSEVISRSMESGAKGHSLDAFLEKLALRDFAYVRCALEPNYGSYEAIKKSERDAIEQIKAKDEDRTYRDEDWANAQTHDNVWNGIQRELLLRGRNILNDRNIWCYKIIDIEKASRNAYRVARKLNDKYMLDAMGPVGIFALLTCFESYAAYRMRLAGGEG
uniref:Photolyase/cryptochrome alpha/beta domain-containing protein n=2 Tax=Rhodosorus marinus TaxID=101924 RepID=A0A7S2ZGA5_9RHOD|mmetsp:Transcript_17945/g.71822  ORF Transcript_17945/g.71822 Transcript_17945/m.71822 type:complete len:477 (+) Transcript_17945:788-2218(+)|eukprot:CAMPEP_0113955144 /NCGR_PEP_ID=MMETSP0011_2-20120614/1093_1 /TAXON_ID=101924 /ORGANISM="Rhodosorus marinus" /LENGTH=476 /DNA_ID=CAMNT_0000964647 /DNA_START=536 /DNA_END=1966 /DNA_ORIENTATION=- /assembly_acc=CAM_ASM_000156